MKAFELCRAGPFNLSHASLTSRQALEALRNLDKTNPTLFNELSSDTAQPSAVFEAESEPEFADVIEDASDIPLEVVQQHIASNSLDTANGYAIDKNGYITRSSNVEDPDCIDEASEAECATQPAVLGRGHRAKKATRPFGGVGWWDC